ncbi:acyl-CoA dehydrogenase family protein [Blastococcus montanus]|uniref:acyl-CoA dehydrogenase family protein n=1 Tax=Blastococcus montanus TaxID=3144973 RepID=UPI00320B6A4A
MTATPIVEGPTSDLSSRLAAALADTVGPEAVAIDATGTFPRASLDALARAGALGLLSSREVGGHGGSLADMAAVVERVAAADGSAAMVLLMHYAASAVLEAHGPEEVRRAIARGEHVSTLAFSEPGSRSHFWAPMSSATPHADHVQLDATKSWVTSAGEADSYVWSSRPVRAKGPMTLWFVPADAPGLTISGPFDGVGLRGNSSRPIQARGVRVATDAQLGHDGEGLTIALATALPTFLVGNAAFSLGLMRALLADASTHLTHTRLEHLGASLAEQPVARAEFARLRMVVDGVEAFLADTLAALASGRGDGTLRVLEVKAVAAEAASDVADGVMKLCGGAAFRKELGVERRFRDTLAARVMAPTTAALQDFVGRISLGLPLFDGADA